MSNDIMQPVVGNSVQEMLEARARKAAEEEIDTLLNSLYSRFAEARYCYTQVILTTKTGAVTTSKSYMVRDLLQMMRDALIAHRIPAHVQHQTKDLFAQIDKVRAQKNMS